jgi:hypothetical protein
MIIRGVLILEDAKGASKKRVNFSVRASKVAFVRETFLRYFVSLLLQRAKVIYHSKL